MIRHLLLAAALAGPAPVQPATAVATAGVVQMPHISVEVVGKGPPVILIPGLASPRAVWDGVTPRLARDHTVFRVQVNGFGGSAPGATLGPGVLAGIVADLHMLIEQRRLRAVPVVGHLMGGLVALMLAHEHPASVGETDWEHLDVAGRFGWRLTRGGLGCMLHGVLPFACKTSGSDTVRDLNAELVAKRSAARAAQTQMTTVEYVI